MQLIFGLNRWEYYVGDSEEKAEKSRNLWLQCYWWDKWHAIMTGKQSLIYVSLRSCMGPKELMDMGVHYAMTVSSIIVAIDPEKSSPKIFYLVLSHIIDDVFKNILYNDNFVGLFDKEDQLDSVLKFVRDARIRLLNLCEKMGLCEKFPKYEEFLEIFFHIRFSTLELFTYMDNLMIRFVNYSDSGSNDGVFGELAVLEEEKSKICRDNLMRVLRISQSPFIIKTAFYTLANMFRMVTSCLNSRSEVISISLMISVSKTFSDMFNDPRISSIDPPFKTLLKRYVKMMLIPSRICFQLYKKSNNEDGLRMMLGN